LPPKISNEKLNRSDDFVFRETTRTLLIMFPLSYLVDLFVKVLIKYDRSCFFESFQSQSRKS
jgi:hypothetical protein